jgi:hypothetical protein
MKDYIATVFILSIYLGPALMGLNLGAWLARNFGPQTKQGKTAASRFKGLAGYFNMLCGRLSLLFIAGGLVIMSADYIHNLWRDDNDAALNTTLCLRAGECEAS